MKIKLLLLSLIILSTSAAAQWFNQPSGTTRMLFGVYFTDAYNGTVVGDSGLILRTTDGGASWIQQESGTIKQLESVFFTDINTGTIVGWNGILRTTDGGIHWVQQLGIIDGLWGVFFKDTNHGIAVGNVGTILQTTDGGISWIDQPKVTYNALMSVSFDDMNNGVIVGSSGTILQTSDGGSNWVVTFSPTTTILHCVSFVDGNITAVGEGGIILRNGIQQSSGTSNNLLGVCFTDANNGTVVGQSCILRTTDGGTHWIQQLVMYYPLFGVSFSDINNGTAVGYPGKILRTTNGGVTFVEEQYNNEKSTEFLLSQNYPNPFNPATKIKYSVPFFSHISIKVFDVLGNEIKTLVNEEKPAGEYELTWNAVNLPSGVYFYQLKAGSFVQTRKMILLK